MSEYPRPFNEWIGEQRRGALHAELSDALNDLTARPPRRRR